jgi:hypothetical protein
VEQERMANAQLLMYLGMGRSIWSRTSFFYVSLNMKVILGLLSTPWYSVAMPVASMKNPPEPELSSGCSMYY